MVRVSDPLIETLSRLIEISKDGVDGYRTASEKSPNGGLNRLFRRFSEERAQFIGQLSEKLGHVGGPAATESLASRALHRGAMILHAASAGESERALLEACRRGEEAALREYKQALLIEFPPDVKIIVERQYMQVQAALERLRAMEIEGESLQDIPGTETEGAPD